MNVLALETTERVGTLAAMAGDRLLCQLSLDPKQRSAQSLAPGIRTLLDRAKWQPGDVQLVATPVGPGSFTGLRVGVASAKAFAYGVGAEVLGVDTLEAIAAAAPEHVTRVSVAMDAQRGEVITQTFERAPDGWFEPIGPSALIEVDAWLQGASPGTPLTGPILRKVAGRVPDGATVLDAACWAPSAPAVARLAVRDHGRGRRDDIWTLLPRYSRPSAAEEKWQKRPG